MTDPIEAIIAQLRKVQEEMNRLDIQVDPSRAGELSAMEVHILRLTAEGYLAKEIAPRVGRSPRTIEQARYRILGKLRAQSMAQAVFLACRKGLIK